MTVPQVVSVRRGSFRPHVDEGLRPNPATADVTRGLLHFSHARTLGERWRGLKQLIRGIFRSRG
jgi:aldehyde dehydrogenase (NAD+)